MPMAVASWLSSPLFTLGDCSSSVVMLAVGGSDSATDTLMDDFSSSSFSIGDGTEDGLFSLSTGDGACVVDVGLGTEDEVTGLGAVIASGLGAVATGLGVVVESGDGVVIDPAVAESGDGATAGVVWLIVLLAATSDDADGDKDSGVGAGADAGTDAGAGAGAAVSSSDAVTLA